MKLWLSISLALCALPQVACATNHARECKDHAPGTLDCRVLTKDKLGDHYCLRNGDDAVHIREIRDDDYWVTQTPKPKDPVIFYKALPTGGSCSNSMKVFNEEDKLTITLFKGDFFLTLKAPDDRVILKSIPMHRDKSLKTGELWLESDTVGDMKYYLYVRDTPVSTAATDLQKYLMLEAYDTSDANCMKDAPKFGTGGNVTIYDGTQNRCEAAAAQTGVGGGGEGPK